MSLTTRLAALSLALAPALVTLTARAAQAECVARHSTPALSPTDANVFPSPIGPALSGPLATLAWGMTEDEAKHAAPTLVKAMRVETSDKISGEDPGDPWLPFAGGEVQLKIGNMGLSTIKLRYPDRATALKALAVWKEPASPDNAQRFEFWSSGKGGARGLLRPDDNGVVIEIGPFVPLADLLAKGLAFAPGGKPLLGRARADVCLPTIDYGRKPDTYLLPTSERSSGYHPIKVDWVDDKVASYKLAVDYTYDRSVRDEVPKLLAKKFGKAKPWTDPTYAVGSPTCLAYGGKGKGKGKGKEPTLWACDGGVVFPRPISIWFIYVGEEPDL